MAPGPVLSVGRHGVRTGDQRELQRAGALARAVERQLRHGVGDDGLRRLRVLREVGDDHLHRDVSRDRDASSRSR